MKANKLQEEELNKIIEDIKIKEKEILNENFKKFSQQEAVKKSTIDSARFQDDFKHAFNKAISLLEANCIHYIQEKNLSISTLENAKKSNEIANNAKNYSKWSMWISFFAVIVAIISLLK